MKAPLNLQAASKFAFRAARRGDVRAADRIELDYIKAHVPLFSRRADDTIPAECVRLCRGAGERGESLLEWQLPNGVTVYSDMDANVMQKHEDEACAVLLSLHPGRQLDLIEA